MNQTISQTEQTHNDIVGKRIASRLTEGANAMPYDISERLRAARTQAVERRKHIIEQSSMAVFSNRGAATLVLGESGSRGRWWQRLGASGALLALVFGLIAINSIQDEAGARELADIDAAILTDDLPPVAYVDAGFAQYLKTSSHQEH